MDDTFGPRLFGHFDFTLLFEHTIFQIAPSAVFVFTLPFYIHKIIKFRPIIRPGWQLWAKLAVAVGILAVHVATAVLWYKSALTSMAAQVAAVMTCVSALGIMILTYTSHSHFLQPVLFLAAYLNVTLLLDLTMIYTYFHRTGLGSIAWLTCCLPPLKFVLLILEEISKRSLIIAENRDQLSNEATAGFWSRSTFMWVNPLLLFGFKNSINNDDLPDIGYQFDSKELYENFKIHWERRNKNSKYALLWTLFSSMPWSFVYVLLPRLFLCGFHFSQPFLLQDVVNATSGELAQPDYISREEETTALILATALVFGGKAISRGWFSHIRNQILVCIRGALISAIYQKSLCLGASESEDSAAAVTLMTTDLPGIEGLISLSYDSVAVILEVAFGIAVLSIFVGVASIFTLVTALGKFFQGSEATAMN